MRHGRRRLGGLLAIVAAVGGSAAAGVAQTPAGPTAPVPEVSPVVLAAPAVTGMDQLVRMSRGELEDLYRQSPVAAVPSGFVPGRAIFDPGSKSTVRKAATTRVVWQGKVFVDGGTTMVNRVFGVFRAVRADVFVGESWFDGNPSLVFDYQGRSKLFGDVRDEVRQVGPGLYLGLTYVRKCPQPKLTNFFTLQEKCGN